MTLDTGRLGDPFPAADDFTIDDVPAVAAAFERLMAGDGSAWWPWAGRLMRLPDWYDSGLDPYGSDYAAQQERLWRAVTGRDRAYDAAIDEQSPPAEAADWRSRPGLYRLGSDAAGDQLLALGHIVRHSDLWPGQRMVEFGPGHGQVALAFARLGVEVTAVDICPVFVEAIRNQAEMFGVKLRAETGAFGDVPEGSGPFDLVLFYEAFHHARDPMTLIRRCRGLLAPGGRIMLAGEPVDRMGPRGMRSPWGLRTAYEPVAVSRVRGWYEGGFDPDFLEAAFAREGFVARLHDASSFAACATLRVFRLDPAAAADAFPKLDAAWRERLDAGWAARPA